MKLFSVLLDKSSIYSVATPSVKKQGEEHSQQIHELNSDRKFSESKVVPKVDPSDSTEPSRPIEMSTLRFSPPKNFSFEPEE